MGYQFTKEEQSKGGSNSKRKSLDTDIKEYLLSVDKDSELTRQELLIEALYKIGLKGNVRAVDTLFSRAYGKVKEVIETNNVLSENPILALLKEQCKDLPIDD